MAAVLERLGTTRAAVVHGTDGLGEISLAAPTEVIEVRGGETLRFTWRPEDFGVATSNLEGLQVDGAAASAAIVRQVLDGQTGRARDIVVLNAAAALWVAGGGDSPLACAQRAAAAIDQGAAQELLSRWVEVSRS
jgi:anthranilate phosphoribosyltransferase